MTRTTLVIATGFAAPLSLGDGRTLHIKVTEVTSSAAAIEVTIEGDALDADQVRDELLRGIVVMAGFDYQRRRALSGERGAIDRQADALYTRLDDLACQLPLPAPPAGDTTT